MLNFLFFSFFLIILSNIIIFVFNLNENYYNVFYVRGLFMFIVVSLHLLFFTLFFMYFTGIYIFINILGFYYILIISGVLLQYVLDNDMVFQTSKMTNLFFSTMYALFVSFFWYKYFILNI